MNTWVLLAIGAGLPLLTMLGLWYWIGRKGQAGIVDVAWASLIGILGGVYALLGAGDRSRRLVAAVLIGIWAVRLASHILVRLGKEKEDPRYEELKKQWAGNASTKLLVFYLFQAAAAFGFSLPLLVACQAETPLSVWDGIGILVWCVAITGESLADYQLKAYKASNPPRGSVCQEGLWRYSRHPNYFFEWVHWFAYVFLALQAPMGWLTVLAPLAMLYFILYVTGIPPTEKQALKSRPESYREYQQTTNAFFPGPPRQRTSE